jgi:rubredoxin
MPPCCPSCGFWFPPFRGVKASYGREPGTSWWRFRPTRFYCQKCGVELLRTFRPSGYVLFTVLYLTPLALCDYDDHRACAERLSRNDHLCYRYTARDVRGTTVGAMDDQADTAVTSSVTSPSNWRLFT